MKLIVAGTRSFNDYQKLKKILDIITTKDTEIICGEAKGADALGKRYSKDNNLVIHSFPVDWDTYGKSAGYKRNLKMAEFADQCIVF